MIRPHFQLHWPHRSNCCRRYRLLPWSLHSQQGVKCTSQASYRCSRCKDSRHRDLGEEVPCQTCHLPQCRPQRPRHQTIQALSRPHFILRPHPSGGGHICRTGPRRQDHSSRTRLSRFGCSTVRSSQDIPLGRRMQRIRCWNRRLDTQSRRASHIPHLSSWLQGPLHRQQVVPPGHQ